MIEDFERQAREADESEENQLNTALEIVKNVLGTNDIKEALIQAMKTPETLQAFALVSQKRPGEYEASLLELRKLGITSKDVENFRKLIKQISWEQTISQKNGNFKKASDLLPDSNCPFPNLIIPPNYNLSLDGTEIYPSNIKIAFAPIGITARLKNVEEGDEFLRIAWRRSGKWEERVIDRGVALEGRRLVQNASYGLPVAGQNASVVAAYLHELEAYNIQTLPPVRVSAHMGWQGRDGRDGFLWGRKLILPNGEMTSELSIEDLALENWQEDWISFQGTTPGDDQILAGFHSNGSLEGWKEAIKPLEKYPKASISLYASLAPPLLKIVDVSNFVVDLSCRTSTGKTTALRAGASAWGNPDEKANGTMFSWDTTKVWLERTAGILNGLPLILDDTKRAKNPRTISEFIYQFCQGRGRGRGNTKSLATTRTWHTILISSGESPAVSFTQEGGTRTRVLQIRGLPFGKDSDETRRIVNQLNSQLIVHYGHAGPAFVSYLLKNRDLWKDYKNQYRSTMEFYAEEANTPEGGRLAQGFAILHLVEVLANAAGLIPWPYGEIIRDIWHAVAIEGVDAAGEVRALQDMISWAHSNVFRFYGRHQTDKDGNPKIGIIGWAGRWDSSSDWDFIGFLPTVLKKELTNLGYEPEGILAGWKAKGWLEVTKGERGYTTQNL